MSEEHFHAPILNFEFKHDRQPVNVLLLENERTVRTIFNIMTTLAMEVRIATEQGMPIEYAHKAGDEDGDIVGIRVGRFRLELVNYRVSLDNKE